MKNEIAEPEIRTVTIKLPQEGKPASSSNPGSADDKHGAGLETSNEAIGVEPHGGSSGPAPPSLEQRQADKIAAIMSRHARTYESIKRIDSYLEGSPLAGYGMWMVKEGDRTGVEPRLCAAVATAESGLANYVPAARAYNAWGMLASGEGSGLIQYGSWREGITAWFDNVNRHWGRDITSAWQLRNPDYCATNTEQWCTNVQGVVDRI